MMAMAPSLDIKASNPNMCLGAVWDDFNLAFFISLLNILCLLAILLNCVQPGLSSKLFSWHALQKSLWLLMRRQMMGHEFAPHFHV